MLIQSGFDLAQLDPMATDFDLIVDATKEFDVSFCPITGPVAGSVKP